MQWLPKILGYDYVIQYEHGLENGGADAFSCVLEFQLLAISFPKADW